MEVYREAAISPANPKQTRVSVKVLLPLFQIFIAVEQPPEDSISYVCMSVGSLFRSCMPHTSPTPPWVYLGHQAALRDSSITSANWKIVILVNALWLQQFLFLAQMAIRQYYSWSAIQITLDYEKPLGYFSNVQLFYGQLQKIHFKFMS